MAKKMMLFFIFCFSVVIFFTNQRARTITFAPIFGDLPVSFVWRVKQDMVEMLKDGEDTVIFGDSTAHGGYYPVIIGEHVFNFALDASTPIEGYFYLKYMIDHGKKPKNVVLSYTYVQYYRYPVNYWDFMLGANTAVFSRKDLKEILAIDQSSLKMIKPFKDGDSQNNIHIPYYYDIASGALNHIKLNFDEHVDSLLRYEDVKTRYFTSRGSPTHSRPDNLAHIENVQIKDRKFCDKPGHLIGTPDAPDTDFKGFGSEGVVQYYFEKLVQLADEQKINVYVMGWPIPESCAASTGNGWHNENLKRFKTIHFEYADRVSVPDAFMLNPDHVNEEGSFYFSQKVKPFFEAMP